MKKKVFRKPNFLIDRSRRGNLSVQIADGLRMAIETGYYRAGDILPPVRDLAEILGVSMGIAVQAVNRIRKEGLISSRPAVGSVVCAKDRPLWKGQVLIVVPPGIGNIGQNAVYAILRDKLTSDGYLALTVTVPYNMAGELDFALLDLMSRQQVDLVVQLHDHKAVTGWLSARKLPFVRFTVSAAPVKGCIGSVLCHYDSALEAFLEHCRMAGVKKVLQVVSMKNGPNAVPRLRAMGVEAAEFRIPPPGKAHNATGLVQRATDEFAGRLAREGRKWLPDVLFFRDDHLATGAFLALMAAGVRIPEDVRVVTWMNRGFGPPFTKPLTRMEQDNVKIGETLAGCVLDYLHNGVFPGGVEVEPAYMKGDTF